jgi:hypothetical protein
MRSRNRPRRTGEHTNQSMSDYTQAHRDAYLGLLEDKFQVRELKGALAQAEQRVAAELQEYDVRCASSKRGIFREIANAFTDLW